MNIDSEFPRKYWLNCGRQQARRYSIQDSLAEANISACRFPAVDGRLIERARRQSCRECYAYTLSQRLAIRRARMAGDAAVLLLGDHVELDAKIEERLAKLHLPGDWGIFLMGCTHIERPSFHGEGLLRVSRSTGSHAIAIRAPYYKAVMKALKQQSESPRCRCCRKHPLEDLQKLIPTYACYPDLVTEKESEHSHKEEKEEASHDPETSLPSGPAGLQAEAWGGTRHHGTQAPASPVKEPKLGLLFLTRGRPNHEIVWQEFLREAGDEVRVLSHVKEPDDAGMLRDHIIPERHVTQWGDISLVRAMNSLLTEAMADPSLTHFAFVSESCVPIKPWCEMKRRLRIDPRSMMDLEDSQSMQARHLKRLKSIDLLDVDHMYKHSQWILLDREAASCVTEFDFTERFSRIQAPDEHYYGTVLSMRGFPIADKVRFTPLTWARWETWPITTPTLHTEADSLLAIELATFPGFFARKFPPGSDIAKWSLHKTSGPDK